MALSRPSDGSTVCLVALVGFHHPLRSNARGLFARCGLSVLEYSDAAYAEHISKTLTFDAVVIDTHRLESSTVQALISAFSAARPGQPDMRISAPPMVVLTSRHWTCPEIASVTDQIVVLPAPRQGYREIARVVRRLCGLPGRCCT